MQVRCSQCQDAGSVLAMPPELVIVHKLNHPVRLFATKLEKFKVFRQGLHVVLKLLRFSFLLLHLIFHCGDLGPAVTCGHCLRLLENLALGWLTSIFVLQAALWPSQVGFNVLLDATIVTATVVEEGLNGGVSLHRMLAAKPLTRACAIHRCDK